MNRTIYTVNRMDDLYQTLMHRRDRRVNSMGALFAFSTDSSASFAVCGGKDVKKPRLPWAMDSTGGTVQWRNRGRRLGHKHCA